MFVDFALQLVNLQPIYGSIRLTMGSRIPYIHADNFSHDQIKKIILHYVPDDKFFKFFSEVFNVGHSVDFQIKIYHSGAIYNFCFAFL